jgi:hypothetical protein
MENPNQTELPLQLRAFLEVITAMVVREYFRQLDEQRKRLLPPDDDYTQLNVQSWYE